MPLRRVLCLLTFGKHDRLYVTQRSHLIPKWVMSKGEVSEVDSPYVIAEAEVDVADTHLFPAIVTYDAFLDEFTSEIGEALASSELPNDAAYLLLKPITAMGDSGAIQEVRAIFDAERDRPGARYAPDDPIWVMY